MKQIILGITILSLLITVYSSEDVFVHHVLETIPVSGDPMGMSLTDDFLYASSFQYPHISIIDIDKNENVDFITTSSSGIMAVEAVPEKNKIYAAPFESGGIDVYALSTKLLIKTISLPESAVTIEATHHQGQRAGLPDLRTGQRPPAR